MRTTAWGESRDSRQAEEDAMAAQFEQIRQWLQRECERTRLESCLSLVDRKFGLGFSMFRKLIQWQAHTLRVRDRILWGGIQHPRSLQSEALFPRCFQQLP